MKTLAATFGVLMSLAAAPTGFSANIIWVSDLLNTGTNTVGAGPYPDQGFVDLLTGAGHSVTRFNPANDTSLSAAEIATLNASNLVIIGRSIASAAFDPAGAPAPDRARLWNTAITKPVLVTNTYMTRASRLGWFTGSTQPDQVLNTLTFPTQANPGLAAARSFIIGSAAMTGNTTTNSITQAITYSDGAVDVRGTSLINEAPVAGGTVIASTAGSGGFIVSWPAGTAVRAGADVLAGYRMQFLAGNRESATAPNTTIGHAGFENLTAEGEGMFLRAVQVALNNGVIPEPATATFLLLAGSVFLRRRRRSV
jgi:hypothetical protein